MLSDAHELLVSGWCQGEDACDELLRPIEPSSAFARRWSARGALERVWRRSLVDGDLALAAFVHANLALAATVGGRPDEWNDAEGRHQAQVLDAVAEAAFLLSKDDADLPSLLTRRASVFPLADSARDLPAA
jgi:hypothetical protein